MTEVRMKDFSRTVSGISFTADGDEYNARLELTPADLQEVLRLNEIASAGDFAVTPQIFKLLLIDESFQRIEPRLETMAPNPIGIYRSIAIINWLVEQLGQRPTRPSEDSTDGSRTGVSGTDLTAGVPNTVSIP